MTDIEVNFNALCFSCVRNNLDGKLVFVDIFVTYEPENVVICCLFFIGSQRNGHKLCRDFRK